MSANSLQFHIDDVTSVDELAQRVTDWEGMALARSNNPALSAEMQRYNLGIADALQAVRLQFVRLNVGIRPFTRSL